MQEEIQQSVERSAMTHELTCSYLRLVLTKGTITARTEGRSLRAGNPPVKAGNCRWLISATAVLCNSPSKVLTDEWRIFLLLNSVICCVHWALVQRPRINVLPFCGRFSRQWRKVHLGKPWSHCWKHPAQGSVGKSPASRLVTLGIFWHTKSIDFFLIIFYL